MIDKKLDYPPIPSDDLKRTLKFAAPDKEDGSCPISVWLGTPTPSPSPVRTPTTGSV